MTIENTMTSKAAKPVKKAKVEIEKELAPEGGGPVHGVTFDGEPVWFARDNELVAFDPTKDAIVKQHAIDGAGAGTAFDGENLYQLAGPQILVVRPADGEVLRKLPAPGGGGSDSGMAWADGFLWVGQYRDAKIHQVDPKTGEVVKTLRSDRWVTGVSLVDGELWHATGKGTEAGADAPVELRRLAEDGSVLESLEVPSDASVSGLERTKDGTFWCGGGASGKLRKMRRSS